MAVKIQSRVMGLLFCGVLLILTACGDSSTSTSDTVPRFEPTTSLVR